jgi:hypothetical protein
VTPATNFNYYYTSTICAVMLHTPTSTCSFVYFLHIIHLSFLCCVKENWFESPNSWRSLNNADTICRIIITGWCQTRCLLLLLLLLSCKRQKTYLFMNLFLAILQNGCAGERYIFGASLTFKSGVKLQISSNLFIHVTRMRI